MTGIGEMRQGKSAAVLVVVAVVILAIGAGVIFMRGPSRKLAADDETPEQRRAALVGAFSGVQVDRNDPDVVAAQRVIQTLGDIARGASQERPASLFELERTLGEIERGDSVKALTGRERREFLRGLETGLNQNFGSMPGGGWIRTDITRATRLDNANEMVVFARTTDDEGYRLRMRFWFVRTDTWRIYDYEETDIANRFSRTSRSLVAAMQGSRANGQAAAQRMQMILRVAQLCAAEQIDEAAKILARIDPNGLTPEVLSLYHLFDGMIKAYREEFAAGIAAFDAALAVNPDMPMVHSLVAACHNHLGNTQAAIESARKSIEQIGENEDACLQLATALRVLDRKDEALEAYRGALRDYAHSIDAIQGIADLTTENRGAVMREVFAKEKLDENQFLVFAEHFNYSDEGDVLAALVGVYREQAGPSVHADFYEVCATIHLEDTEKAAELARRMLTTDHPRYQDAVIDNYILAMSSLGRTKEAYETVPRPDRAIRYLVDHFDAEDLAPLEAVFNAHLARFPDDAHAKYGMAQILTSTNRREQAEEIYQSLPADALPDRAIAIRWHRVRNLHELKGPAGAYAAMEKTRVVFDQLAELIDDENRYDQLPELLEAHAAHDPTDPMTRLWRAELAFRAHDFTTTLDHLAAGKSALDDEERFFYRYELLQMRSLAAVGRKDEALALRSDVPIEWIGNLQTLAIAIYARDIPLAEDMLGRLLNEKVTYWKSAITDPVTMKILESPEFAHWREKYPPLFESDESPDDNDE